MHLELIILDKFSLVSFKKQTDVCTFLYFKNFSIPFRTIQIVLRTRLEYYHSQTKIIRKVNYLFPNSLIRKKKLELTELNDNDDVSVLLLSINFLRAR